MMKVLEYPAKETWPSLNQRPNKTQRNIDSVVKKIIEEVKNNGDQALFNYTVEFDQVKLSSLAVSQDELEQTELSNSLREAIFLAQSNIENFHSNQLYQEPIIETTPGVKCWRKSVPIKKVGLYIPGGTAPLLSTVLMLGIPATLAGCGEIILCTPPDKFGNVNPGILYTANLVGINKVFKVGGAQAIAALAYGTQTVPMVDKIFGPGNQFVTTAKELVRMDGTAIDMPAGPSELMVIADTSCNPAFVAADLLSQAEHGEDSQVVLLTNTKEIVTQIQEELVKQCNTLPRKKIAEESLKNSSYVLMESLEECIAYCNQYAPEHLIIATNKNEDIVGKIYNAGSVFLGNYSCESAGDYASGTNHTLPTNGYARNHSGVSVDSFMKKITYQELTPQGLQRIGPAIELLAEAEQLEAHKNAVSIRLKSLNND